MCKIRKYKQTVKQCPATLSEDEPHFDNLVALGMREHCQNHCT